MKNWKVALYARVSTEKEEQKDSIPAQLQSLREWIAQKSREDKEASYTIARTYEDWGKSGSSFDRESFLELKRDIEEGLVNMVITRDLSRFGRNYIQAGYYLEDYFRVNGVRFVSVLDNVDTADEINDIVPFRNILNEMYVKDCSRRSRDGLKQRMLRGSYIGARPPYGYKTEEACEGGQKTIRLVPANDESTETVKLIYRLYLQGWGYARISGYLNERKIAPPGRAYRYHHLSKHGGWGENGIKSILRNPKYAGRMIQGQYKKLSYKLAKTVRTEEKDWIYGGDFEGIVTGEEFDRVQEEMKRRAGSYRYKHGNIHIFSGVLQCGDCGGALGYRAGYEGYKCINSQRGGKRCTQHSIKEKLLESLVSEDLRRFAGAVDVEKLAEKHKGTIAGRNDEMRIKLSNIGKELCRLQNKLMRAYDDKLENVISEESFEAISREIRERQCRLQMEKDKLSAEYKETFAIEEEYGKLRESISELLRFECLTRKIVEELIDKIVITEDVENKKKNIEIKYRFSSPEQQL